MSFNSAVCNKLLMTLSNAGIEPDEAMAFFGEQILDMQSCPPNYGKHVNNEHMKLNYHKSFWIMRGFFPETPIMFKIVMLEIGEKQFYAKITLPPVTLYKKFGPPVTFLDDTLLVSILNDKVNYILVSDSDAIPKIVIQQRTPKCMSPKGAKIHNLMKKKRTNK